jgi:hypothetical protein
MGRSRSKLEHWQPVKSSRTVEKVQLSQKNPGLHSKNIRITSSEITERSPQRRHKIQAGSVHMHSPSVATGETGERFFTSSRSLSQIEEAP